MSGQRGGPLAVVLEEAHRLGVRAASEGLQDAALGSLRLTGPGVLVLAEAAVSSATPFLRSPLLARISAARLLHSLDETGCTSCGTVAACPTNRALQW